MSEQAQEAQVIDELSRLKAEHDAESCHTNRAIIDAKMGAILDAHRPAQPQEASAPNRPPKPDHNRPCPKCGGSWRKVGENHYEHKCDPSAEASAQGEVEEAKKRVLEKWPDAVSGERGNQQSAIWKNRYPIADKPLGVGFTEDAAWLDAASKLPTTPNGATVKGEDKPSDGTDEIIPCAEALKCAKFIYEAHEEVVCEVFGKSYRPAERSSRPGIVAKMIQLAIDAEVKRHTAQPPAPLESGEREAFEAWWLSGTKPQGIARSPEGHYLLMGAQLQWAAWQARSLYRTSVQQWIPVSERLPERPETCLVAYLFQGKHPCQAVATLMGESWVNLNLEPIQVTHWMPLPARPSADTEKEGL